LGQGMRSRGDGEPGGDGEVGDTQLPGLQERHQDSEPGAVGHDREAIGQTVDVDGGLGGKGIADAVGITQPFGVVGGNQVHNMTVVVHCTVVHMSVTVRGLAEVREAGESPARSQPL
jgi:hypothetical protein